MDDQTKGNGGEVRTDCKNNLCEYFNRTAKKGCMITVCLENVNYIGLGGN